MAVVHAGVLRVDLRIPAMQSLKEKRHVIKTLTTRLTKNFLVAVAEVDHQDQWQRATIAIAAVAASAGHLDRILHTVTRDLDHDDRIEVLATSTAYLEEPA